MGSFFGDFPLLRVKIGFNQEIPFLEDRSDAAFYVRLAEGNHISINWRDLLLRSW